MDVGLGETPLAAHLSAGQLAALRQFLHLLGGKVKIAGQARDVEIAVRHGAHIFPDTGPCVHPALISPLTQWPDFGQSRNPRTVVPAVPPANLFAVIWGNATLFHGVQARRLNDILQLGFVSPDIASKARRPSAMQVCPDLGQLVSLRRLLPEAEIVGADDVCHHRLHVRLAAGPRGRAVRRVGGQPPRRARFHRRGGRTRLRGGA